MDPRDELLADTQRKFAEFSDSPDVGGGPGMPGKYRRISPATDRVAEQG